MPRPLLTLLPLAALAVAAAGCGSGGGSTTVVVHDTTPARTVTVNPGGPMRTATTPVPNGRRPSPQRVTRVVHEEAFQSPSGNIGCIVANDLARCDLKTKEWRTLRPNDCPKEVGFGQGIQVGGSGPAGPVCGGDTTLNPTATVLPYGTASQVDGFRCVSSARGMSCRNPATRHGFFVSRQTFTTS